MTTNKTEFLRKHGWKANLSYSLAELSTISGVPEDILQEVFNRGIGAWKTNPSSVRIKGTFAKNPDMTKYPREKRLSKEQWAYARVYSFLNGGKTRYTADRDLWIKAKEEMRKRKN